MIEDNNLQQINTTNKRNNRNKRCDIYVSKLEYDAAMKKANKAGLSLSSYARELINNDNIETMTKMQMFKRISETAKSANNLLHAAREQSDPKLKQQAFDAASKIIELITELREQVRGK